jgi:hypothetical protein
MQEVRFRLHETNATTWHASKPLARSSDGTCIPCKRSSEPALEHGHELPEKHVMSSVHVWNDESDIDRAIEVIRPFVRSV